MERGLVSKVVLIVVAHGNEANLTFCNQIAPRLAPMSGQCRRVNAAGSDRTKGEMPFLWPEHRSAEGREFEIRQGISQTHRSKALITGSMSTTGGSSIAPIGSPEGTAVADPEPMK